MNIELIRLKRKLAIMDIDGSNQVFMDLMNLLNIVTEDTMQLNIKYLKNSYEFEIKKLEKQESKYKQIELL